MSKVSVFDQGWIDLVFEGRNKSYGAYQLRRQDSRTTIIALFSGIALIAALVAIPTAINYFKADSNPAITYDFGSEKIIEVEAVPLAKKPKPLPQHPQEPAAAAANSARQVQFTTPVVTTTTTPVDLTITDLLNGNPSNHNDPGDNNGNIAIGANGSSDGTETTGTGTGTAPGTDTIELSGNVDKAPEFPGGLKSFYTMVGDRFRAPESDTKMTVRVYVYFVVEKDGTMSNIKVMNKPGEDLEREALRVLKSIRTKWTPGKKNGQFVRTAYNLPIMVNVN